jgi:hypothetical protein
MLYATQPLVGANQTLNNTMNAGAVAEALKTPKGIAKKPLAPIANKTATAAFDKDKAADDKSTIGTGGAAGGATVNIGGTLVPLDNI